MSVDSEIAFLLGRFRLDSGEELLSAFECSLTGAGFMGWEGIVAVSQLRVFLSSEPGLLSSGRAVCARWPELKSFRLDGTAFRVNLGGGSDIKATINNLFMEDVRQAAANVEAFIGVRLANRVFCDARAKFDEAAAALSRGDTSTVRASIDLVAAQDTQTALVDVLRARLALALGAPQEALAACETAERRGYEAADELAMLRADVLASADRLDEAEREVRRALDNGAGGRAPVMLAELLMRRGAPEEAVALLGPVVVAQPDDRIAAATLLRATIRAGDRAAAEQALAHAAELDAVSEAETSFARGMLARWSGALDSAIDHFKWALALEPAILTWAAHLADALDDLERYEEVVETVRRLRGRHGDAALPSVLAGLEARALRELRRWGEALEAADRVLSRDEPYSQGKRYALVTRTRALVELGRHEEAQSMIASIRAHAADESIPLPPLGRRSDVQYADFLDAKILAARGDLAGALSLLRGVARLERVGSNRRIVDEASHLEDEIRSRLDALHGDGGDTSSTIPFAGHRDVTARLLSELEQRLARLPALAEASAEARRLRDEHDRPMLLAVLGEFNAGKSTFINALLGAEVLPTDIIPTTATINLVTHGEEAGARVVWRDGSTTEIGLDRLRRYVVEREDAADVLRSIDHVIIRLPHDVLRGVEIVDTPGLNARVEHTDVTRRFVSRADAVLWLFRADQAGTASELSFLGGMEDLAGKSLAVVNQIDRIPRGEVAEVVEGVRQDFAGRFSGVVGVSARNALVARLRSDDGLMSSSGFPALEALLHRVVFSQSRSIKRMSTVLKGVRLIEVARQLEAVELARIDEAIGASNALHEALATAAKEMSRETERLGEAGRAQFAAACSAGGAPLAALLARHGTAIPAVDIAFVSTPLRDALVRAVSHMADGQDRVAKRHLETALAFVRSLAEGTTAPTVQRLIAELEILGPARLRENDLLLEAVAAHVRGMLDADDLATVAYAAAAAGISDGATLGLHVVQRYAFAVERSKERMVQWASDYYRLIADVAERLVAERRVERESLRQEVFRPIARLEPAFASLLSREERPVTSDHATRPPVSAAAHGGWPPSTAQSPSG